MISQRCPRCYSRRIRRGYRQTSFLSKLFFRYHLLCDSCNWEFKGFAVPGTVSSKSKKSGKSKSTPVVKSQTNEESDLAEKLIEFNEKIEKEKSLNRKLILEEDDNSQVREKTSTKSSDIS